MNLREILTLAPLIVMCFWIGLYPKPFFEMTANSTGKIVAAVNGVAARKEAAKVAAASAASAAEVIVPATVVVAPAPAPAAPPAPHPAPAGK